MNETMFDTFIGKLVRYTGDNREGLYPLIGLVEKVNDKSAGIRYDDNRAFGYTDRDGLVWAAHWAWTVVEDSPTLAETTDIDKMFTEAAGGKLEVAKAEIVRLKAEIAKLENFVEVYERL